MSSISCEEKTWEGRQRRCKDGTVKEMFKRSRDLLIHPHLQSFLGKGVRQRTDSARVQLLLFCKETLKQLVPDHKLADIVALSTKKELLRRVQQWLVEEHQIEQAVAETFPFEEIKIFIQNELKHRRLASGISTSNKRPVKRQKACLIDNPSLLMDFLAKLKQSITDNGIDVNADVFRDIGIVDRCVSHLQQQGLPQDWFCFLDVLRSELALQCPMFDNLTLSTKVDLARHVGHWIRRHLARARPGRFRRTARDDGVVTENSEM